MRSLCVVVTAFVLVAVGGRWPPSHASPSPGAETEAGVSSEAFRSHLPVLRVQDLDPGWVSRTDQGEGAGHIDKPEWIDLQDPLFPPLPEDHSEPSKTTVPPPQTTLSAVDETVFPLDDARSREWFEKWNLQGEEENAFLGSGDGYSTGLGSGAAQPHPGTGVDIGDGDSSTGDASSDSTADSGSSDAVKDGNESVVSSSSELSEGEWAASGVGGGVAVVGGVYAVTRWRRARAARSARHTQEDDKDDEEEGSDSGSGQGRKRSISHDASGSESGSEGDEEQGKVSVHHDD
jgi:hypothetical protein